MTSVLITPPTAGLWRKTGASQDFPILAETRLRIKKQLQNRRVSFDDLAPLVEQDAALCLHLQQEVARTRPNSLAQVSGAASCLALLGLESLVKLMKHLPVVAADTDDVHLQLYRRALLTAQLAGNLAADWAGVLNNTTPHYARWSTLMSSAPLWLWLLQHPPVRNWLHLLGNDIDLLPASRMIFGPAQREWPQLARQLHLPAMAQALYEPAQWPDRAQWRHLRRHDPRDSDDQRALMHRCHQPFMICLMANALAWHWHIAPDSPRTRRWQQLIANWLGRSVHILRPHLRQLQVQTTRNQHSSAATGLHLLVSPATAYQPYPWVNPMGQEDIPPAGLRLRLGEHLPGTADSASRNSAPSRTTSTATTPAQPPERRQDALYMKKLLRRLQHEPDSFGDLHYLMRGMLKGICSGLGMPAACIALLNRERTALKVLYSEGLSEQAPLRSFLIDLRTPSLFSKLMEKQSAVLLNPDNRARYLTHIPPAMAARLPQHCMMMSIDAGAQPIGLVMALGNDNQPPFTQAEFIDFKNLCIVTCHGLTALRINTEQRRQRPPTD